METKKKVLLKWIFYSVKARSYHFLFWGCYYCCFVSVNLKRNKITPYVEAAFSFRTNKLVAATPAHPQSKLLYSLRETLYVYRIYKKMVSKQSGFSLERVKTIAHIILK